MTRKEHKQAARLKPIGLEGIEACRTIVREHQCAKVNEVLIDAFSASVITQIFDALSEKNRANLITRPIAQVAGICFKLIK